MEKDEEFVKKLMKNVNEILGEINYEKPDNDNVKKCFEKTVSFMTEEVYRIKDFYYIKKQEPMLWYKIVHKWIKRDLKKELPIIKACDVLSNQENKDSEFYMTYYNLINEKPNDITSMYIGGLKTELGERLFDQKYNNKSLEECYKFANDFVNNLIDFGAKLEINTNLKRASVCLKEYEK